MSLVPSFSSRNGIQIEVDLERLDVVVVVKRAAGVDRGAKIHLGRGERRAAALPLPRRHHRAVVQEQ